MPEASVEHMREIIVQSQRVIYTFDDNEQTLTVLALLHVRQDLAGQALPPWR